MSLLSVQPLRRLSLVPSSHAKPLVLLFAAVAVVALAEFYWLNWLRSAEARFADVFVAAQAGNIKPDPDIVVVAADENSLEQMVEYAGRWPWPRSVHGEIVQGIQMQKPRAIVFDVMFFEPDIYRLDADELFNKVVARYSNVYFPTARQDPSGDPYGLPITELQAALGASVDVYGESVLGFLERREAEGHIVVQGERNFAHVLASIDQNRVMVEAEHDAAVDGALALAVRRHEGFVGARDEQLRWHTVRYVVNCA